MPDKPPVRNEDPADVSFSWPGQQRRTESGILDSRLKARAEREAAEREKEKEKEAEARAARAKQAEQSGRARRPGEASVQGNRAGDYRPPPVENRAKPLTRGVTPRPATRLKPPPSPSSSQSSPSSSGSGSPSPNLPARQKPTPGTASDARERWIVTELRRQAVASEQSMRDVTERMDQLSRTLRQVVDYLPRLQGRTASGSASAGSAEALGADAAVSRRLDELEARIEARFDEVAGAVVARVEQQGGLVVSGPGSAAGGGDTAAIAAVDLSAVRTQVREEMQQITKYLADLGEHLRAELVTAAGQAEARLNRDRDQLREALNQTMAKLNDVMGGAVSRDDLRQYWVEMAAKLAKQTDSVVAEREQLRADIAGRMDEMTAERELLRKEISERLARVADATNARTREGSENQALAAAAAAQKASIDELRRELQQLGAQLLAATNPKNRQSSLDEATIETLKNSMSQAAAAFTSAASKNDIETLRNQLAGTVSRLERAMVTRVEEDQRVWDEQLATALEAVRLSVESADLNRRAIVADISAAVRAVMTGITGVIPKG